MRFAGSALAMLFFLCSTVVADENEELSKATKKTSALESYSFTMYIEIEGSPMPMDPFEFEGKSQGDILYLSGDLMGQEFEMFKNGDTVVGSSGCAQTGVVYGQRCDDRRGRVVPFAKWHGISVGNGRGAQIEAGLNLSVI